MNDIRHNAGALAIVRACVHALPSARNIAFFDTSFHVTMPAHITTYPISPEVATKNKLRKYGFHGLSYAFITRNCATYLQKPVEKTNLIMLHLGSGTSACVVRGGKSWDNSMGLTPLEGLPGATRSGSVDPSLIFHFTHSAGKLSPQSSKEMHITTAEQILNKESGWAALTGTTDFGAVSQKAAEGDEMCRLAFDVLADRIVGFVGGYFAKVGGEVDALVFAGGIGEKGVALRKAVIEKVECLGFALDATRNEKPNYGEEVVAEIGEGKGGKKTLVCQTDEQFEMARGVAADTELLDR